MCRSAEAVSHAHPSKKENCRKCFRFLQSSLSERRDLELRRIAVPELTYRLEFDAHEEACYDVVVDPMCRVRPLHGDVMGHLIVENRAAYLAWLETLPMRRDAATKDGEILGEDE